MLVNNIEICRKYLRIAKHVTFDQLQQKMDDMQLKLISEIFGREFISAISTRYNNGTPSPALTSNEATLITLLQGAIVNLGFVKAIPSLITSFDGSGLYQAAAGTNKPLYEWQKLELENTFIEEGWYNIGVGLELCFAQRATTEFAKWKDSAEEKRSRALFILSTGDFNDRFQIGRSYRTFEAVKSFIRESENLYIRPLLGSSLFNAIKTQLLTQAPDTNNALLLGYINDALVNLTMATALAKLEFKFDEEGARIVSTTSAGGAKAKVKMAGEIEKQRMTIAQCMDTGQKYLSDLRSFLIENAGDYTGFVVPEDGTISNEDTPSFCI
jgi:hypothetical protein